MFNCSLTSPSLFDAGLASFWGTKTAIESRLRCILSFRDRYGQAVIASRTAGVARQSKGGESLHRYPEAEVVINP